MKKIFSLIIFVLICLTLIATPEEESEKLQAIRAVMQEYDYDTAFLYTNQFISEYPNSQNSYEARLLLSEIHLERGHYSETRLQIMLLLSNPYQMTFQQRARTYYFLGLSYYREANYLNAIDSFERLFLDYRDTPEAVVVIPTFFDCYFNIDDYQDAIIKARELQKGFTDPEIQAELLYQQARAYIAGNIIDQAKQILAELSNKYSGTVASSKAIELQILILEKESGLRVATERLEAELTKIIPREIDERLNWLLVNYYIRQNQTAKATEKLDFIITKYSLSEYLSTYYLAWLRLMLQDNNPRAILAREEAIVKVSRNRPEATAIFYLIAKAHVQAQDYWPARAILNENMAIATTDTLRFDYQYLYADIYTAQGQYMNSIDVYYSLLNQFSSLGRNYDVLMKLGNIHLYNINQPAQALNFYRQAVSIAKTVELSSAALLLCSECLEASGQYAEALASLSQIPLEQLADSRKREELSNKITLLYLFYVADTRSTFTNIIMQQASGGNATIVSNAKMLALELKQYDDALSLLKTQNTYETRIEKVKLYFLLAYKEILQSNPAEASTYLTLIQAERGQLGRNITSHDQHMLHACNDFLNNSAKLTSRNIASTTSYVNDPAPNTSGINLQNFFANQLFNYYLDNNLKDDMLQLAPKITIDPFVSNLDYQKVNILLASEYYNQGLYTDALRYYPKAERYLTLSYPIYYYQYAMSLYETQNTAKALEILQKIVLNYIDHPDLLNARNMILTYWLGLNPPRLADALDVLNQIPQLKRVDDDYRYFVQVYNRLDEPQKEKESILFIREKTWPELERLAYLHYVTGDEVMSENTWNDILTRAPDKVQKLNAYAGLGNMKLSGEKYSDALTRYEQYFGLYTANMPEAGLVVPPSTTLKETIISCYMANNRPKADTYKRNYAAMLKNADITRELELYEGIYYLRSEPKKSVRLLSSVIDDSKANDVIYFKALNYRGKAYIQDKKPELAEKDLVAALNIPDRDLKNEVRISLGNLYLSLNNYDRALDNYYAVINTDVDGRLARDAANNFAIAAREANAWDLAIAAYKIIMDRWGQSPLSHESRLTIGFCFLQAKQYDQALNLLNQLFGELTSNALRAETLYWLGEAYAAKSNFTEAENAWQTIKSRFSTEGRWVGVSQLKIAELYYTKGDIEKSKALFNEIIRIYGANSDEGKEARKFLIAME